MGLCTASGAFQRLMETVLSGLTFEVVLLYLDDKLVFGRCFEQFINRLELVFRRIWDVNLKISLNNCSSKRISGSCNRTFFWVMLCLLRI